MKRYFYCIQTALALLLIAATISSCEVETEASGTVVNAKTGDPVVAAHVMQLAVTKKTAELISETYTDSLGSFYMDAGLSSYGARRVKLQLIVEKAGYATTIKENNSSPVTIKTRKY